MNESTSPARSPRDVVVFSATAPWVTRLAEDLAGHGLRVRRMRLDSGLSLVDWNACLAVIFSPDAEHAPRVAELLRELSRRAPPIACMAHVAKVPDWIWVFQESGATWLFDSLFDVPRVTEILRRVASWNDSLAPASPGPFPDANGMASNEGVWEAIARGVIDRALASWPPPR